MNKPLKSHEAHSRFPRPQFRLGSLMAFTTGLCAVSAILAALHIDPLHVLGAVTLFAIGVAVVALQVELTLIASGTRDRQRYGEERRRW